MENVHEFSSTTMAEKKNGISFFIKSVERILLRTLCKVKKRKEKEMIGAFPF